MKLSDHDFIEAAGVRRAVVPEGDIRGEIAFQNDINTIMAGLDAKNPPIQALGWIQQPVTSLSKGDEPGLRVIRGGGIRSKFAPDRGPRAAMARRA